MNGRSFCVSENPASETMRKRYWENSTGLTLRETFSAPGTTAATERRWAGQLSSAHRHSALTRSRPCARRICRGALYERFFPRLQRRDTFDLCKGLQRIKAGSGAIRRRKASRIYKNEIPRAWRVVFLHVLCYARYSPVSSLRTRSALFSATRVVHAMSLRKKFCFKLLTIHMLHDIMMISK